MTYVCVRVNFCITLLYRLGQINRHRLAVMSQPSYAPPPDETKALYPSVPPDQVQQPEPGGYYPQQQPLAAPTAPYQTSVTYYPPTGPQQQQQPQQLVVTQTPVVVAQTQRAQSFVGHIILSCIVTWCCCCPCGLIAFILASKSIFTDYVFEAKNYPLTSLLAKSNPIQ